VDSLLDKIFFPPKTKHGRSSGIVFQQVIFGSFENVCVDYFFACSPTPFISEETSASMYN